MSEKILYIDMDGVIVEWLHFGGGRFPDWPAVVAYLKERA